MQGHDISDLVQSQLRRLAHPHRRASLESYLISPQKVSLAWDYGSEGERFDCWRVGQSPSGDIWLMYCQDGFGPEFPWGFVFPDSKSLGMDSQWHSRLEDAAICIGLLEAPDDYESPGPRP